MTGPAWTTALVTGASSGIGEAFARALATRGTNLVVVARRRDRLEQLAAQLRERHGIDVEVLTADLADPPQLATVEERLSDTARPVDLLVNAAGFGSQGKFVKLPIDREDEQIRVNVLALVRLTRAGLPGMVERRHGAVVNVSSLSGHQPMPLWATYAATKAFVTSFSLAVNAELDGTGVQVLSLMPGFTRTEFHDHTPEFSREFIPGPAWMTADAVVERALADLERGRDGSIPGAHYRALALASRLSPWPLTRRVLSVATRRFR
jgi:short-subunit dehydrogenase